MLEVLNKLDNFNIDSNLLITVLNDVGAYIYMKDLEGNYTYANKLVLELLILVWKILLEKMTLIFLI